MSIDLCIELREKVEKRGCNFEREFHQRKIKK